MKNICIIGVGNIGSRHLQGIKKVKQLLSIHVIDPSSDSLLVAKQRYGQIQSLIKHQISYNTTYTALPPKLDICIIATGSKVRMEVLSKVLKKAKVKYLILEKLLFTNPSDYKKAQTLLQKAQSKAFVNCSMRTMPFYYNLKKHLKNTPIDYTVHGSQYGLITNAIHYIDHLAFLCNTSDFSVNTDSLDPKPIDSKRPGYLELNGVLLIQFKNSSTASIRCFPSGNSPVVVEIQSQYLSCISKESESVAWIATHRSGWQWQEIKTDLPYQSDMTNVVVEQLLKTGKCNLVSLEQSAKIHLQLLDPLLDFLNQHSKLKYDYYPFT